ncbi:MAG: hypothetical protein HRT47_00005 [Candidatus Caenarcaniphilales bacterium]|nr:hypothetical protein [Candidatus Caenarcaniphilales bacterium]
MPLKNTLLKLGTIPLVFTMTASTADHEKLLINDPEKSRSDGVELCKYNAPAIGGIENTESLDCKNFSSDKYNFLIGLNRKTHEIEIFPVVKEQFGEDKHGFPVIINKDQIVKDYKQAEKLYGNALFARFNDKGEEQVYSFSTFEDAKVTREKIINEQTKNRTNCYEFAVKSIDIEGTDPGETNNVLKFSSLYSPEIDKKEGSRPVKINLTSLEYA